MHFLDDYLELLDPLPEIMREKLTLMRETDLKIQAECVQLEEDASHFLSNYRLYQRQSSLSPTRSKINVHRSQPTTDATENEQQLTSEQRAAQQQKQFEYDKLVQRYQQLLKSTTAKVTLANESHEIIERYYKKLEHDLNKFKMELEADYAGLTETLEKRFASEGFNEYENSIGENSYDPSILDMEPLFDPLDDPSMNGSLTDDYTSQSTLGYLTSASQSRRFSTGLLPPSTPTSMLNRKQPQQRLLSMQSTTAVAAAAATARGRKRLQGTSSINPPNSNTKRKRSSTRNPFLNESHHPHPLHHILPPSDSDESSSTSNLPSNNNNNNNNNNPPTDYFHLNSQTSASPHLFDDDTNGGTTGDFDSSNVLTSFASGQTSTNAAIDDRRYCFCNELSYGDMIACDNPLCRREWFHYPCVGIVTPPKGKWFCAECSQMQQQHQQQQQQQQQQQSQILTTKRASTSSQ